MVQKYLLYTKQRNKHPLSLADIKAKHKANALHLLRINNFNFVCKFGKPNISALNNPLHFITGFIRQVSTRMNFC